MSKMVWHCHLKWGTDAIVVIGNRLLMRANKGWPGKSQALHKMKRFT